MVADTGMVPKLTVVIPTYNRSELLFRTLEALEAQRLPKDEWEVVVADDGSSDATREVVAGFARRLRVRYHFQEDLGFRAGAARNAGARLASAPLLAFLDTGVLVGPDFVRGHLRAHQNADLVVGYTYGYNIYAPHPGLGGSLDGLDPEQIIERFGDAPLFQDMRHTSLARVEFVMERLVAPWFFTWTANLSVKADAFRAAGGFDEDFRGWGVEDLELGYRLVRGGARVALSKDAWGIEMPHERDAEANITGSLPNALLLLKKHPDPLVEMFVALYSKNIAALEDEYWGLEEGHRSLLAWTEQARKIAVCDELAGASSGAFDRIAVFGSGGSVPPEWPDFCALVEFDHTLLEKGLADGRHHGVHGLGLRTPFPDQSFDLVIISSRLAGLWSMWRIDLLAEAHRIGRTVRVPFASEEA